MAKSKVTLKDVARHAGVSVGSVSRYLNQHPSVSAKAQQSIGAAIKKLNYTPNQMAQKFAKGVTGNLLLYIYQEFPIFNTTWLFELPIIHGIYEYLHNTEYALQIAIGAVSKPEQFDNDIMRQVAARQVDGVMILSSWPAEEKTIRHLADLDFPYALIGNANPCGNHNYIAFDNEQAVFELVDKLYRLGHREFAFLGGYESQLHTAERLAGFKRGLETHSLAVVPEWIKFGDYSFESGITMMNAVMNSRVPTAIIAGNDYVALGAMRSIRDHGFSTPKDVSVTGFDDLNIARMVEPGLTTVSAPLFEIGKIATQKLVEGIAEKNHLFSPETVRCSIIERGSTGRAKPGLPIANS